MVKREPHKDSKSQPARSASTTAAAGPLLSQLQSQLSSQQQNLTDTSWSCLNNGGMSGIFPMFDPDSYASYFQNFPMGDSEMMGGDDGGGDDPLSFLIDYMDDTALPLPVAPTSVEALAGITRASNNIPSYPNLSNHRQNDMFLGFDDTSSHSTLHDFSDSFLQPSNLPYSMMGDMIPINGSIGYHSSACTPSINTPTNNTLVAGGNSASFVPTSSFPALTLQKPQPFQHPSSSSLTSVSPKPKGNFLPPPAMLYNPGIATSSNTTSLNDCGQQVQQHSSRVGGVSGGKPAPLMNEQSYPVPTSSTPAASVFYNSILDAQLLQRNTPSSTTSTSTTNTSNSKAWNQLPSMISSTSQKSSPESSISSVSKPVVDVAPGGGEGRIAGNLVPNTVSTLTSSVKNSGSSIMKGDIDKTLSSNRVLPGIPLGLKTAPLPTNTNISPTFPHPQQQGILPMLVSSSDTDGDVPSGINKKEKNHQLSRELKTTAIVATASAPKRGRGAKSKVKIEKPPTIPFTSSKVKTESVLESNPSLYGMMVPPSSSGGATSTSATTSTTSSEDTKMNLDHPGQSFLLQLQEDMEVETAEDDKTQSNRERNREHARNTRLRKKAYVENLKQTLDDLCKERDALVLERTEAAKSLIETNQSQIQVILTFFALRAQCEKRRSVLASIMDENISCIFPITPYRSFPSSEVQVAKCQRTIMGIDGMIADAASLNVLLNSFVDRSRFPEGEVKYHYDVIVEEAVAAGNQMMVRWKLSTTNLESLGAQNEVRKYGMLCARFSSSHKIVAIEIMFDVMAFMLQLKQCSRNQEFTIVPNTLQTCQGFHSIPMVITIAERPYTIIQVNRTWESLTGWMAEEVVGKASCKILHGPQTDMKALDDLMTEIRFKRPARSVLVNYTKGMTLMFRNFLNVYPLSTDSKITHYVGLTTHFERMQHVGKRVNTECEIPLVGPFSLNGCVSVPLSSLSSSDGPISSVVSTCTDSGEKKKQSETQTLDNI